MREALEETACHFTPEALLGVYLARNPDSDRGPGVTYMRFAFCGTASDPVPGRALDSPVVRTLWMTADEIAAAKRSPARPAGAAVHRGPPRRPPPAAGRDLHAPSVALPMWAVTPSRKSRRRASRTRSARPKA